MVDRLLALWELRKYLFKTLIRKGYKIRSWCAILEPPNHVHMVVDCDYVPKFLLSDLWHRTTGDSFIVDIQAVNVEDDPRKAFGYLTKYLGKISKWEGFDLEDLKGTHLINSSGLTRGARTRTLVFLRCRDCGFDPVWNHICEESYWMQVEDYLKLEPPSDDYWVEEGKWDYVRQYLDTTMDPPEWKILRASIDQGAVG
jgi:hypothetical protein